MIKSVFSKGILIEINKIIPNIINAFLYFGGSLIQLGIALFSSPIFARHLSPEQFATIGYFRSLGTFIVPLTLLNFTHYYQMQYFRQGASDNKKLFANLISFLTLSNAVILIVSYGAIALYFKMANVNFTLWPFAAILIFSLFLDFYRSFILLEFRISKKAFKYFLVHSFIAVFGVLFSLLFVVYFKWGAAGRMSGILVPQFIVILLLFYFARKSFKFKIDFGVIKESFKFSYPMLISAYFYIPISNIDKIFIERLGDIKELGFYMIGFNIASYFDTAAKSLGAAFEPDFINYIVHKNQKKLFIKGAAFASLLILMTVVFAFLSESIVDFLTSGRYTRAYSYANLHVIAILFMNLSGISNAALIALKKPKLMLLANIISGGMGIFIYKITIDYWGIIGACYGRILISIVYFVSMLLVVLLRKREVK